MKYLCLCYYNTEMFAALSPEEVAEIGPSCKPYDSLLRETGKVIAHGSFAGQEDWRTLKPVNRKPVAANGPLTKAPEVAGAFFIIEANDIDEATSVASNHAAANYGEHVGMAVEVRPCDSFD